MPVCLVLRNRGNDHLALQSTKNAKEKCLLSPYRRVSKGARDRRNTGLNSAPGSMLGMSTRMLRTGSLRMESGCV